MWQPLQSVTFSHSVCLNTAQLCVCVVSLCNPGASDGGLNLRPLTGLCLSVCLSVSRQTVSSWVRSTRRRRPAVWPLAVWAARRAAAAARPPRPRPRPPLCALLPATALSPPPQSPPPRSDTPPRRPSPLHTHRHSQLCRRPVDTVSVWTYGVYICV